MTLSEKLKLLRMGRHLKQDDVAKACNVTRSTVANWELGRRNPGLENIMTISKIFQISLENLLNDDFCLNINFEMPQETTTKKPKKTKFFVRPFFKTLILFILIICLLVIGIVNIGLYVNNGLLKSSKYTATLRLKQTSGLYTCFDFEEKPNTNDKETLILENIDITDEYFIKYSFLGPQACMLYIEIFNRNQRYSNFEFIQDDNFYNDNLKIWKNRIPYISKSGTYNISLKINKNKCFISVIDN